MHEDVLVVTTNQQPAFSQPAHAFSRAHIYRATLPSHREGKMGSENIKKKVQMKEARNEYERMKRASKVSGLTVGRYK